MAAAELALTFLSFYNSSIISAGSLPKVSGSSQVQKVHISANVPKTIMILKPLLRHRLIKGAAKVCESPPKILMKPIPMILTCVGNN
jgi:hypothetical protein